MELESAFEVWETVRPHIAGGFQEAADDFVSLLIEHGNDPNEIAECATDSYIKASLRDHVDDIEDESDLVDLDEEYDDYGY